MADLKIKSKILLVDDEANVLEMLKELLSDQYEVVLASSGQEAIDAVRQNKDIATVVMDIKMAGMDGIATAREIRKMEPDIPVIFHTGYPGDYDQDEINDNEKPFDYVQKGDAVSNLNRSIRNAVENYKLKKNLRDLSGFAERNFKMIGRSAQMQEIYRFIEKAANNDSKVLICGETGSGKEMVAKAIHENSKRKDHPFRFYICNSHKSPDMTESELFGHLKGSFTGATEDRTGVFEYADGGTVLLDEIGDMDLITQQKLLRVLDSGEYTKIGSPVVRKTNVRVICATHRDLEEMVRRGLFRDDLYYRIDELKVTLPPLRDRREDISLLAERFRDEITMEEGIAPKIFDEEALAVLINYDWPGNVRQLRKVVSALILMTDSDFICAEDVELELKTSRDEGKKEISGRKTLAQAIEECKRNTISSALHETGGNIAKAARLLDVDRANLAKLIKSLGIRYK
ncbi:putative Acetoacetate metabolism regulatory protein AtoC [Candidatus Zixiibacteriota bacterium]|nr:putative Acetoacetate metabolism regulatory protein AtoC [candidate division Zixibacteria bacterium]